MVHKVSTLLVEVTVATFSCGTKKLRKWYNSLREITLVW